jgi:manganese transport protein
VAGDGMAAVLVPGFGGTESVLLAAGIVGATVMPHAIYLHSALTQDLPGDADTSGGPGTGKARHRALRATRWDVIVAMSLAGFINITILVAGTALAASDGDSLEVAHEAFGMLSGPAIGVAFAVGLLASGLASACVGVYTGQIVMQGFVRRRIPLWLRRVVSMAVPLILLSVGLDPMLALVLSQVALSFGIPFALVPLLLLTRDRRIMGEMVNRRITTVLATVVAALIVALNLFMLVTLFGEVVA